MKKIFFLVFFVSAMLLMNLYVFSGTKDEYIQYLKKHTNEPIQKVFYDDFDNNGSYEMFAIVGKETPEGTIIGNIYYINDLFTQHNQVSLDVFEEIKKVE